MNSILRDILAKHGRLPVPMESLADDADLFEAGLDSLAIINIMLAIEDRLEVEFRDEFLVRASFASVDALTQVVGSLRAESRAG